MLTPEESRLTEYLRICATEIRELNNRIAALESTQHALANANNPCRNINRFSSGERQCSRERDSGRGFPSSTFW